MKPTRAGGIDLRSKAAATDSNAQARSSWVFLLLPFRTLSPALFTPGIQGFRFVQAMPRRIHVTGLPWHPSLCVLLHGMVCMYLREVCRTSTEAQSKGKDVDLVTSAMPRSVRRPSSIPPLSACQGERKAADNPSLPTSGQPEPLLPAAPAATPRAASGPATSNAMPSALAPHTQGAPWGSCFEGNPFS